MHRPRVVAVDVAVDVPELVGLVDVVAVVVAELVTVVVYRHESHRTGQFRSVASRVLGSARGRVVLAVASRRGGGRTHRARCGGGGGACARAARGGGD